MRVLFLRKRVLALIMVLITGVFLFWVFVHISEVAEDVYVQNSFQEIGGQVRITTDKGSLTPFSSEKTVVHGPYTQSAQTDSVYICWDTQQGGELQHKEIKIDGLKPAKTYYYVVQGSGKTGRFVTPPPVGAVTPFSFLVYGDSRTRSLVAQQVAAKMIEKCPESAFVMHTGDFVTSPLKAHFWDREFWKAEGDLLAQFVFYPCIGNHERNCKVYFDIFKLPGTEDHYSFNWGKVHFTVLETSANEIIVSKQASWLDKDLQDNSQAKYKVVVFHHPSYTSYEKLGKENRFARQYFVPVMEKNGVRVVFNGHSHNYQHHLVKGIHYFVTGGAGAPLHPPGTRLETVVKQEKREHFLQVAVEQDKLMIKAYDINGQRFDEVEIKPR